LTGLGRGPTAPYSRPTTTLTQGEGEDLDEFLLQLADLSIDINDGKDQVRVFCE